MGNINKDLSSNDTAFTNMEKVLNYILFPEKNKSHNINILKEIGYAKQYSVLTDKNHNELISISQNQISIKNYIPNSKDKSYFIKWTNALFDINEEDYNLYLHYNQKIQKLRDSFFNKAFFQKNINKNIIQNKSNIKIFKYGIPKYLREFIWEIIIAEKYANEKYFNREEEKEEYNSFINRNKNIVNNQIQKDIYRTFSENKYQNEKNQNILKNLLFYASSLTKDGYCQGMNFIISFILKVTNFDEIKSYYIIKNIIPKIKGYYENSFPLLKKNINLFCKLFNELYPKLNSHFTKNDVFAQFWVGRWFQTLFTLSFPFDELCYIWDLLLIKGFDFSIYISLAIIYYLEKYLIKLNDSSDILQFLKNALNPEDKNIVNINKENDKKKYIIPLSKIFIKALDIEKEINKNENLKQIIINSNNEDYESIYSQNTKETDNSITNKNIILNSSCLSTLSNKSAYLNNDNSTPRTSNASSKIVKDKNSNEIRNISNNNNLGYRHINTNHVINNNFKNNINEKKVFHLFENVNLAERINDNLAVNNYTSFNLNNYYYNMNIPDTKQQYSCYNNLTNNTNNYINLPYSNLFFYYPM